MDNLIALEGLMNEIADIPEPHCGPTTFKCSTCGYPKSHNAYRKDPSNARGYSYECKVCQKLRYARARAGKSKPLNPQVAKYVARIHEIGPEAAQAQIDTALRLLKAYKKALKITKNENK